MSGTTVARAVTAMRRVGLIHAEDRYRLRPSGPGAVLDVGCGQNKWPGAVGIDISADTAADVVADLNEFPWPLEDDSFDQILCQDVIEHVDDIIPFLRELHRVSRPGARIHLRTPHYTSVLAYSDPTHKHYLSAMAVRTFEQALFSHYDVPDLRVVDVTLDFWDPWRWLGIAALANRFQSTYEMLFAFWFPAMNIRAELEVVQRP